MIHSVSAIEFARVLIKFPEHLPISDAYEMAYLPGKRWWTSQRQHMVGWFSELAGPGAYNRKTRGLDAKYGYNHLQCAPALLWIAEALGEDSALVKAAANRAAEYRPAASQCAAIRSVVAWTRIEELVKRHIVRLRLPA